MAGKSKLIVITGSPGAGESTLAKALCSKFGFIHIDIHGFEKSCGTYNSKKDCYDLDMDKVEVKISEILDSSKDKGDITFVFDSHVSHLLHPSIVDLCVVVRCNNLKKLRARLETRGYSEAKVSENLECEIMEVCHDEASEKLGKFGVEIVEVDGSLDSGYSEEVLEKVKSKFS